MVNTFLICKNWIVSAKCLDSQRLWKQVVEGRQILQVIQDLKYIISFGNYQFQNWDDIKSIIILYKQWDNVFVRKDDFYFMVKRSEVSKFLIDDSYKEVKLGFVHHPIVKMWWSYTEALKYYINIHITEHINRHPDSNVEKYYCKYNDITPVEFTSFYSTLSKEDFMNVNLNIIPPKILSPCWINDSRLYSIHRGNLKSKNEKFYTMFPEQPMNGYSYELFYDPIFSGLQIQFDFSVQKVDFIFS